jgi:putative OPT family oligopeptide transporter
MAEKEYEPYISADSYMAELTFRVILIGIILAMVMGAANAYLGLYVGMTVSATIPAMVMSIAILKPMRGTILEINTSKSIAVAGEALAAGIIFTIPALLILNSKYTDGAAGWTNLMDNIMIIIIVALLGGFLGILFTIPMRKVMIDDLNLPYPEGVASAEVLKTIVPKDESEQTSSGGMFYIFSALIIAGIFKLSSSEFGFNLWKEKIEGVAGSGQARLFGGLNLSPALLGVGIILGHRIASLVFMGGVIGWIILIPLIGGLVGWPTQGDYVVSMGPYLGGVYQIWFDYTMYVGIGAIVTGGIYTLIKMRKAIVQGIKEGFGSGKEEADAPKPKRTEYDLKLKYWYFGVIAVIMALLYYYVTNDVLIALVAMLMMLLFTFFFTSIAAYLAGVVGSSNNPISGVTVATMLFTAILLLILQADANMGMTATIIVGAVVCCSAAIAGDSMQELKTGQLLGATPYNLQIARFIGVASAAISVPFVVVVLHQVYEIGSPSLPAPQAYVMANIANGIFQGQMNWALFVLGIVVALILIYLDLPVMAVAIGIYLPFTLTLPIMMGGIIKYSTDKFIKKKVTLIDKKSDNLTDEQCTNKISSLKAKVSNRGILFASGLIAGEAILGVIIAAIVIAGINLALIGESASWPGLLVFGYLMFLLCYILLRDILKTLNFSQLKTITMNILFRRK